TGEEVAATGGRRKLDALTRLVASGVPNRRRTAKPGQYGETAARSRTVGRRSLSSGGAHLRGVWFVRTDPRDGSSRRPGWLLWLQGRPGGGLFLQGHRDKWTEQPLLFSTFRN